MGKDSNLFWLMSNLKGKQKRNSRFMVLCGLGVMLLALFLKAFFHKDTGETAFYMSVGMFFMTMGIANGLIALLRQQEPPKPQ